MRAAIMGVLMGLTVAVSLKNEGKITPQIVRASLVTEILFIIVFGIWELY